MMRATLIALAMLLVLGCAAVCEEPTEARAIPATTPGEGMSGASLCTAGPELHFRFYSIGAGILGLAAIGCFVAGLIRRRHTWKPLVLGAFAFGIGLLGTVNEIGSDLVAIADKPGLANASDLAEMAWGSLMSLRTGICVALLGGLLTVILYWRNERVRAGQAGAKAEEAAEG